jgi:hypothetical protein
MSYDSPMILNPAGGGSWLSTQLVGQYAASNFRPGTTAWTSDNGQLISDGVSWTTNSGLQNNSLNGRYLPILPQSQTGANSNSGGFYVNLITAQFPHQINDDVVTNIGYNITGAGNQIMQPTVDPFCFGFQFESHYERTVLTSTATATTTTTTLVDSSRTGASVWTTGELVGYNLCNLTRNITKKILSNTPNSVTTDVIANQASGDSYQIMRPDMEWFRIMNSTDLSSGASINCRWDQTTVDKVSAIKSAVRRSITGVASTNPTVFNVAAGDSIGLWGNGVTQGVVTIEFITPAEDPTVSYPAAWAAVLFDSGGKSKTFAALWNSDTSFKLALNSTGYTTVGLSAKFRTMPMFDLGGTATVSTVYGQGFTFELPLVGASPGDESNMCAKFELGAYTFATPTCLGYGNQHIAGNPFNPDVNINLKSALDGAAKIDTFVRNLSGQPNSYLQTTRTYYLSNAGFGPAYQLSLYDTNGSNPSAFIDISRTGAGVIGNALASSTSLVGATSSVKVDATGVTLTLGSAATLLKTATNLTSYNASSSPTLGSAGPSGLGSTTANKWIAINDNGTTRYIPTWT